MSLFVFLFTKSDKVIAKPITEVHNLAITEKQRFITKIWLWNKKCMGSFEGNKKGVKTKRKGGIV